MDISSLGSGDYGYLQDAMSSMRAQRGQQGPPPGPPPEKVDGSDEGGKEGFLNELTSLVMESDADEDGSLNIDELGVDEEEFSRMDSDGDGLVSSEELKADISNGLDEMKAKMDEMKARMEESGDLGELYAEGMVRNQAMQAYTGQLTLGSLLESGSGFGAVA